MSAGYEPSVVPVVFEPRDIAFSSSIMAILTLLMAPIALFILSENLLHVCGQTCFFGSADSLSFENIKLKHDIRRGDIKQRVFTRDFW